jgi:hypothetical protein
MTTLCDCKGCLSLRLMKDNPDRYKCSFQNEDCPCKECLVKVTCNFGLGEISSTYCEKFTLFVNILRTKKHIKRLKR